MRVINILEEGRFGGPQRRVLEVAKELEKYDVKTTIIYPESNSEAFSAKLSIAGQSHLSLKINRLTSNPVGLIKYVVSFIPEILRLKSIIRESGHSIVHVNGAYQIKGVIAANLMNVPSVWHLNDTYAPAPVRWLFYIVKRLARTNFISAAERTKSYYLGNVKKYEDSPVVNEPVNCLHFTPEKRASLDKKFIVRILLVGNLSPVKAIEVYLEMASYLNAETDRRLEFVILGKKLESQIAYYESLIRKKEQLNLTNVEFLGSIYDVKSELQRADLYVCSSNFESSPMSIWEAMSMALPIVSTDVGDVKRVLEEGACGLTAEVGNGKQLASRINFYLSNPKVAKAHGENARREALKSFDISICVAAHYELYRKIWNN